MRVIAMMSFDPVWVAHTPEIGRAVRRAPRINTFPFSLTPEGLTRLSERVNALVEAPNTGQELTAKRCGQKSLARELLFDWGSDSIRASQADPQPWTMARPLRNSAMLDFGHAFVLSAWG